MRGTTVILLVVAILFFPVTLCCLILAADILVAFLPVVAIVAGIILIKYGIDKFSQNDKDTKRRKRPSRHKRR